MIRYYFYHADFFVTDATSPQANREGGMHGIWVVEDDSTPDVILAAIEKWLYAQSDVQAQNSPPSSGQASSATVSYVIRQFNNIS